MATCRDCAHEVLWGELPTGKKIALEPASLKQPAGLRTFVLLKGMATVATDQDRRLHRPLYVCHWDACPAKGK